MADRQLQVPLDVIELTILLAMSLGAFAFLVVHMREIFLFAIRGKGNEVKFREALRSAARNGLGLTLLFAACLTLIPGVSGPGWIFAAVGIALIERSAWNQAKVRALSLPAVREGVNRARELFGAPRLGLSASAPAHSDIFHHKKR